MTYKEAKDNLKEYWVKYKGKLDEKTLQTIRRAINALNRCDPWMPDIYGDGYADGEMVYDMWQCPNCGKSYELDHDEYDYCPCCGQAIDWSEYEEDICETKS